MWSKRKVIRTSLTSVADANALYNKPPITPTLTTLPAHSISEEVMRSIFHFNNPTISNFKLRTNTNRIYLNKKTAFQLSSYLSKEAGPELLRDKSIPDYLFDLISGVSLYDYLFATYFIYMQYIHCGIVGVIESEWVCELLELSLIAGEASLRDLCLHLITTHMANGATELVQSKHWINVVAHLETSLTVANTAFYLHLAKQDKNREMRKKIGKFVRTRSKCTAQKVMTELLRLSQSTTESLDSS